MQAAELFDFINEVLDLGGAEAAQKTWWKNYTKKSKKKKNRDQEEEKEVTAQDLKGMNMLDLRVSYILKINLNKKINCFALFLCRLPLGYLI